MGNILEQAGSVNFDPTTTFAQSDVGAGVIRTRVIDENVKGDFTFIFPFATEATVAAVLAFADEFAFGTFPVKIPDPDGNGQTFFLELVERPDIRRVNARLSSITVRARRALAVDTD